MVNRFQKLLSNSSCAATICSTQSEKLVPIPDSKPEVRSFTGFCNFHKRLIPGYSILMAPLHDLLRDEIPNSVEAFNKQGCCTPQHTNALRKVIVTMTKFLVV
jgi:hypothetical protein